MRRLIGYLAFGFVAWLAGRLIFSLLRNREIFFGVVYIVLSISMAYYSLFVSKEKCLVSNLNGVVNKYLYNRKWVFTASLGFLTGINLCSPFLLAFSSSARTNDLPLSVLFFFMFFLGTSIYFLPTVFIGAFSTRQVLKTIGKMTAGITAFYFF